MNGSVIFRGDKMLDLICVITISTSTSVCLSVRLPSAVRPCVREIIQIPAVVSQNVTNKSCLACVMSEKYAP